MTYLQSLVVVVFEAGSLTGVFGVHSRSGFRTHVETDVTVQRSESKK